MKSIIDEEQKATKDIFEFPISIPVYQRPFVWDNSQVEKALQTITEDKDENIESYLGNILVLELTHAQKKYTEIVDGQQRITFLYLFLLALFELMDELPIDEKDGFLFNELQDSLDNIKRMLKPSENERFNGCELRIYYPSDKSNEGLLNVSSAIFDNKIKKDKRLKIVKTFTFLKTQIIEALQIDKSDTTSAAKFKILKSSLDYITRDVKFIRITLRKPKYATEVFERMNSTSKGLTAYELFKNYIAGELYKANDLIDIDNKIIDIDDLVNSNDSKIDTNILFRSLLVYKMGKVPSTKYKYEEIKRIYSSSGMSALGLYEDVIGFIQGYSNFESMTFNNQKIKFIYKIITMYGFKQLKTYLIAMLNKFDESDELADLFGKLLSFNWKRVVFKGEVANVIESLLADIFSDGSLLSPTLVLDKLKVKTIYIKTINEVIDQKDFNSVTKQEFSKVLWVYAIYSEYTNIDLISGTTNKTFDINLNSNEIQIEHILPRSYEENWEDIVKGLEIDEVDSLIDNPGNKMPLFGKYNKKASNKSFERKKKENYVFSSLAGTDVKKDMESADKWVFINIKNSFINYVVEQDCWTKEKIDERSEKLFKFFIAEINKEFEK